MSTVASSLELLCLILLLLQSANKFKIACQEESDSAALSTSTSSTPPTLVTVREITEIAEDCTSEQFYYFPQSRCRNCSDITHLFQSYQEWLGREVSDIRRNNFKNNQEQGRRADKNYSSTYNSKDKKNANSSNKQLPTIIFNDNNNNNNNEGPSFTDGDVLARLINVDAQDEEYTDSSQDISDGSSSIESTDSKADIIKSTKQTQKLISRFIRSSFIGNELLGAIDQCRQYQNVSACQMWSNLCMTTMYSYSDIPTAHSTQSTATSTLAHDSRKENYENESLDQPKKTWQQCRQFNVNSICNSLRDWYRLEKKPSIDMLNIYAVDDPLVKVGSGLTTFKLSQQIQFLAYKYSFDGHLIGVDHFGLSDMEKFCVILDKNFRLYQPESNFIRLGKNMQLDCRFSSAQASLYSIKHFNETTFVDLYIGYPANGAMFLKPVPILIKNLLYNGIQVNRKHEKDSSRWKLVHRFFFRTSLTLDDDQNDEEVLLYARRAVLEFKFKRHERGAILSTLLLKLDYGQVQKSYLIAANSSSSSNLQAFNHSSPIYESKISIVQNLQDMHSYKKDLDLVMTILSVLGSIWSLIKCYNIQKCHGLVKLDLGSLFRFIIIGCNTLANLFALATLLFMSYLWMTLKFQTSVQVLSIPEELENAIILNLQLVFFLKTIGLLNRLFIQLDMDIFFIDWEKPKMLTSSQILNHALHYSQQQPKQENTQNTLISSADSKFSIPGQQQPSFWRPYTVINRWLQLQTLRRQNLTFQLFFFACSVSLIEITNLGTADIDWNLAFTSKQHLHPHQKQLQLAPHNSTAFRLLTLTIVYLILSVSQILYKKHIYEPMVRSRVREFIDLCSVANVSLFCMLYPRFGYYIHGRNANGSGECGIAEMNALLEREERDLCSKRGLSPNSDHQTFVLILPRIINDHYKKLLYRDESASGKLATPFSQSKQLSRASGDGVLKTALSLSLSSTSTHSFGHSRAFIESFVIRNKSINTFLINFLEHIYKDIDYSVRERKRFENFLLDVDFDDESSATTGNGTLTSNHLDSRPAAATFCADHNDSFTSLLWLGLEMDLVLVELLTLLVLDLWFGQPVVITISLVWTLHHILKALYVSYSRNNLINKALIDEKFLLRC